MSVFVAPGASAGRSAGSAWRWAVPVLAALVVVVSVPALSAVPQSGTTYAGMSPVLLALTIAVLAALAGAAALAWSEAAWRLAAGAALLTALGWLAPVWTGWVDGPGLVRSLGLLAAPLLVPGLVELALVGERRGTIPAAAVRVVAGTWVITVAATLGRLAVRDPLLDPYCWSNCTDNVFLVRSLPTVARALDVAWLWAVVAVAAVTAAVLLAERRAARRDRWQLALPAAAALGAEAWYAVLLLLQPAENP